MPTLTEQDKRKMMYDFEDKHERTKCTLCERTIYPTQSFYIDDNKNPICIPCFLKFQNKTQSQEKTEEFKRMKWNPFDEFYASIFPKKDKAK